MLEALMREDELTLARISLSSCFNQTPLHLACMLGHFEFAKSLLSYKPEFASRLDSQGRSPLHLASANGYANIVKILLKHDWKMCRTFDEDGRTPLHLAVMNGEHECVRELIKVNSDQSYNQELGTALHLCVMYNRLNVLILILESTHQDLSSIKDDKGNTILHSAATLRRLQIIRYLVMSTSEVLNVNAVNENGVTALEIVERMPKDVKTMEIKELLVSAGTLRAADQNVQAVEAAAETDKDSKWVKKMWNKFTNFTIFQEKQEKRDNTLLVAASVIAAMSYQAAISPPGGVSAMDATEYSRDHNQFDSPKYKRYHLDPAVSLLAYFNPNLSYTFWISNHISFMASLTVIFLYVSGATLKRRFFTWIIRAAMWITLTSMTIAYVCAVSATTGSTEYYDTLYPLLFGLLAWGILIFVSIVVLVYRLHRYYIVPTFKKNTSTHIEDSTASKSANTNIV